MKFPTHIINEITQIMYVFEVIYYDINIVREISINHGTYMLFNMNSLKFASHISNFDVGGIKV